MSSVTIMLLCSLLLLSCLTHAIQPGASPAISAPLRDLVFGELNFLHTTDTHGWHAGHLLEPSYSADWGDYLSFIHHVRTQLEESNRDLLVIDTGDRIEGNGLYDASIPRGIYTFPIVSSVPIDILSVGNHELYKNTSAVDDYAHLVSKHYLATNLDIYINNTLTPFADRYRTFTTKHGIKILAFGFIFDFTRNDKNTVVIPVEDVVKEQWFVDAITDANVDLFLVIGHVALRQIELDVIYHAIRHLSNTPIQLFGGHFHIRDARRLDANAHALASGRFMETIGFASISGLKSKQRVLESANPSAQPAESSNESASQLSKTQVTFHRRYIDNNLHSLMHHSNTTPSTFHTEDGLNVSSLIARSRSALKLDETFGCAPKTFWMSRVPYPHHNSIFSLLVDRIFPSIRNPARAEKSRMIITNTGAIRFDIFEGPFTRDSTFIVSPFTSDLSYIADVPWRLARQVLGVLNGGPPQAGTLSASEVCLAEKSEMFDLRRLAIPEQRARWARKQQGYDWCMNREKNLKEEVLRLDGVGNTDVRDGSARGEVQKSVKTKLDITGQQQVVHEKLFPGYTTHDDFGDDGDDTIHSPVEYFDVPNCVQAVIPKRGSSIGAEDGALSKESTDEVNDEVVDLAFNQFLTPYIVSILNLAPDTRVRWCDGQRCEYKKMLVGDGFKRFEFGGSQFEQVEEADTKLKRHHYSEADVQNYVPGQTFTSVLANWIAHNWPCDEVKEL